MLRPRLSPWIRRVLVGVLATVAVAYLALGGFLWHSMNQSPEYFGRVMSRMPQPVVFLLYPFQIIHHNIGERRNQCLIGRFHQPLGTDHRGQRGRRDGAIKGQENENAGVGELADQG